MLAQRSLLTKLSFGFGAVIVLLITVAVVAVDRMGAMNDAEQRIVALHVAGIRQTGAIRTETVWLLARQFQRTYAIDPARQAEYDKDIRARLKRVDQLLTDFSALDLAPEERTLCDEYRALWTPYAELCKKFLSLVADNRVSEANMLLLGDMSESHTTLLNKLNELVESANQASHAAAAAGESVYARSRLILLGLSLAAALLGIVIAWRLGTSVARPVAAMCRAAEAVARGEYETPLPPESLFHGELAGLRASLGKMLAAILAALEQSREISRKAEAEAQRALEAQHEAETAQAKAQEQAGAIAEAVNGMRAVIERLSSSSEELSAQVEQSSTGSQEQSRRVSDTAAAMEQMNASIRNVAQNAGQADQAARRASEQAAQGTEGVKAAVRGMQALSTEAQALRQGMDSLGEQAHNIGNILNVINDIADQTNLLALNAAIEAARAGDAGRGFAVVADEVRKLAEKTMQATSQVETATRGMVDITDTSIANVGSVAESIGGLSRQAEESGQALERIVELVRDVSGQVAQIATASDQQTSASDEIVHSVDDIDRIAGQTAEAMRQSSVAVGELAEQAQTLEGLVQGLRRDEA